MISGEDTSMTRELEKRIAVLEEALEPFANMDDANMNDPLSKWLRVGHIKAAVAALNGTSRKSGA